ncbi:MAG: AAA family ATPase [Lachnospiraceae bacterium]|nr:AAA family ATPase [Lachnospiraceae bacterium]
MISHLKERGISHEQIIEMNFESMAFADMTPRELYDNVRDRIIPDKRMYLFFDEVQRITGWENASLTQIIILSTNPAEPH